MTSLSDLAEALPADAQRTIPFDYAFRFELTGQPQKVLNRTVTVSVEAPFVAVAIGYGAVPTAEPIRFGLDPAELKKNGELARSIPFAATLASLETRFVASRQPRAALESVLRNGFRLNPEFAELVLIAFQRNQRLPDAVAEKVFEAVGVAPEQIQFLYALFDEGSGRAFQSDAILNTAGLGISTGERPFRQLAQPIRFEPRATIRMEITELTPFRGELHVSLQGYKILGSAGTATDLRRTMRRRARLMRR